MIRRQYHVVSRPAAEVVENEEPVLVYDSPEFEALNKISHTAGVRAA